MKSRTLGRQKKYRNFAELSANSPFISHWQIECLSEGGGEAVLRLEIREMHKNSIGTVHGGVIAALADTACGMALLATVPAGVGYVTANLNVNYIGIPKGRHIEARAKVVSLRKRMAFAQADVVDEANHQVASASVVFSLLPAETK
jgi:uncharacterized protein (TIGR00369 family)